MITVRCLVVLLFLALGREGAGAERPYRVVEVHLPSVLTPGNSGVAGEKSYIVNMGMVQGLIPGTLLNVYRENKVAADIGNNVMRTVTPIAQLEAITVEEQFALAWLVKSFRSQGTSGRPEPVLVDDRVLPVCVINAGGLFAQGASSLPAGRIEQLEEAARFIVIYHPSKVIIEGHTDNDGGPILNMNLSKDRASAVRAYLISHMSIDPHVFFISPWGGSRPIAGNNTPDGKSQNRRFEIVLLP